MPSGRSGVFFKAGEGDVEMRTLTINTNINVEIDLATDLSDKEKQGLINELYGQGFMSYDIKLDHLNSDFDKLVSKIIGNKHQLTIDEERIICEIAEKIIL